MSRYVDRQTDRSRALRVESGGGGNRGQQKWGEGDWLGTTERELG